VIVVTAAIRPDAANRKMERQMANCAAFVVKPCDHGLLVSVIARVLSGERGIEEVHHPGTPTVMPSDASK
jgi:hypothetical protein